MSVFFKILTATRKVFIIHRKFDTVKYPKNIVLYAKWFPMFLAIPYNLWEWALLNNNTNVDVNKNVVNNYDSNLHF